MKKGSSTFYWPQLLWRTVFPLTAMVELSAALGFLNITPTFTTSGLVLTSIAAWVGVEWANKVKVHYSHTPLHWTIVVTIIVIVLADAVGDLSHLYAHFPQYDAVLHFIVPFILAIILHILLQGRYPKAPQSLLILAAITLSVTLSAVYEVEEYLEDLFFDSNRLGDAFDTANDLMLDTLGALLLWPLEKLRNRK